MERESFENEKVAQLMNENFINIKVDREERPDVDKVYMTFVQSLTGGGGWPLNVWISPELKPFHGGSKFNNLIFLSLFPTKFWLWKTKFLCNFESHF
jgi:uncharacterized protein